MSAVAGRRPNPPSDHDVELVFAHLSDSLGAVTREELGYRTGLHERVVRESIAELVAQGIPIVTDRSHGGYVLTRDVEKLKAEIGRLKSAATRILERAHAVEKHLS